MKLPRIHDMSISCVPATFHGNRIRYTKTDFRGAGRCVKGQGQNFQRALLFGKKGHFPKKKSLHLYKVGGC